MGLYDTWLNFRDRCLTSSRFHDFALKFPLTRPIVRKRQSELFDVVSGFVYSQILLACVELDILRSPKLKTGGLTCDELADYASLGVDEARRLGDGACALRLLEKRKGLYRLGDLGAALSINDGALAMIRHHKAFYKDLEDPLDLLRAGRRETNLSRYWDYARSADPASAEPEDVAEYSELMSASQQAVSEEIIASFDFSGFTHLMDVGGGQGTFLSNVANALPGLELSLFDLPEVANRAKNRQENGKLPNKINAFGGSFFDDELPKGADLITLVRILHDHDDAPVARILANVHSALAPGGTVLIAEPMSTGGHAHRISDAYFNFYLYAMGSGRPRSPEDLIAFLTQAGFVNPRLHRSRSPFTASLVSAQK